MDEFAALQYEKLREEIMSLETRVGRVQITSASMIPVILVVSQEERLGLEYLAIVAPLFCWIAIRLIVYLQASLMRCGRYIRDHLEPCLNEGGLLPWEAYLEIDGLRQPERALRASISVTFLIYYVFSCGAAVFVLKQPEVPDWLSVPSYIIYGVVLIHGICSSFREFPTGTGTTTKLEQNKSE